MPISSKHLLSLMSRHLLALSLFTTRHALAPIKISIDTKSIMRFFLNLVNSRSCFWWQNYNRLFERFHRVLWTLPGPLVFLNAKT